MNAREKADCRRFMDQAQGDPHVALLLAVRELHVLAGVLSLGYVRICPVAGDGLSAEEKEHEYS